MNNFGADFVGSFGQILRPGNVDGLRFGFVSFAFVYVEYSAIDNDSGGFRPHKLLHRSLICDVESGMFER